MLDSVPLLCRMAAMPYPAYKSRSLKIVDRISVSAIRPTNKRNARALVAQAD